MSDDHLPREIMAQETQDVATSGDMEADVIAPGRHGSRHERETVALSLLAEAPSLVTPSVRPVHIVQHEVGCIDSYGFSHAAGAWIAIGWVPCLPSSLHECDLTMYFARASLTGRCYRAPFFRADLESNRQGVIVLAGCAGRDLGPLLSMTLTWDGGDAQLFSTEQVEHLTDTPITGVARTLLTNAPRDLASLAILRALSQPRFGGNTTLHEVGAPIHMAVDEVIRCGDAGAVLIGWFVAEEGATRRILLRAGQHSFELDLGRAIRIRREDVSSSIMTAHGLHEPSPGYILFVPNVAELDASAHLQIETRDLSVGYVALPRPRLRGAVPRSCSRTTPSSIAASPSSRCRSSRAGCSRCIRARACASRAGGGSNITAPSPVPAW